MGWGRIDWDAFLVGVVGMAVDAGGGDGLINGLLSKELISLGTSLRDESESESRKSDGRSRSFKRTRLFSGMGFFFVGKRSVLLQMHGFFFMVFVFGGFTKYFDFTSSLVITRCESSVITNPKKDRPEACTFPEFPCHFPEGCFQAGHQTAVDLYKTLSFAFDVAAYACSFRS